EGYKLVLEVDSLRACDAWMATWEGIEREMEEREIRTVEQFDPVFDGEQRIVQWGPDFEMELYKASQDAAAYASMRIAFCSRYLTRMENPNELNGLNMRKAIAEAHFKLGEAKE